MNDLTHVFAIQCAFILNIRVKHSADACITAPLPCVFTVQDRPVCEKRSHISHNGRGGESSMRTRAMVTEYEQTLRDGSSDSLRGKETCLE